MARYDSRLDLAEFQIALRALRYSHFSSDIFDEYGWDMLIHLYIADIRGQPIHADALIDITSKSRAVGERWLRHLVSEEMVRRDEDGNVALTSRSRAQMDAFHVDVMTTADA